MSLPPELRILCLRLTSTPPKDLPNLTPTLVQYVLQCQIPLSNPSVNSGKADASQSAVLVHKLKTQLTTLLNCKSAEGRFAAIVLIKVVIEVGGWEILRDAGSWVRGMLSVLGKPDSSATKELCIVALTKIYCMTHQYQTLVFRAVVEDWESTAGYIAEPVNVNEELSGGARTPEDLSRWTGIDAGVERLVGLLEFLDEYLKGSTPSAVTIPIRSIFDVITRILSISLPSPTDSNSGNVRLHPAIDRDERDGLSAGLPKVFVSVLHLINTMSATLEQGFVSLAHGSLDLLMWSFTSGKNHQEFRASTYSLACKILPLVSQSLDKSRISKLVPIMRACCKDLETSYSGLSSEAKSQPKVASSQNADTLLHGSISTIVVVDPNVVAAASSLLPVLLSDLPQGYLDISMRSQLERTAILGRNKEAMLASILNPFVGKNGKALASVLPHITRAFPNDDAVEILLRPRMPIIPARHNHTALNDLAEDHDTEDDIMETIDDEAITNNKGDDSDVQNFPQLASETEARSPQQESSTRLGSHNGFSTTDNRTVMEECAPLPSQRFTETQPLHQRTINTDTVMSYDDADGSDSDSDGSVHLTMQLDSSDSE
ncbi:hypothetical protein EYC84_003405 [Monilinia fructicola]|uniref:Pre-rRNA-processing protein RIX1 n=1 Tax=Monilinia fructicola TaxID=38448 RepID=A0A5M9JTI8_MONFR|nr:hypothetical protein EYC84_003405 [Monilinia fructicola]